MEPVWAEPWYGPVAAAVAAAALALTARTRWAILPVVIRWVDPPQ